MDPHPKRSRASAVLRSALAIGHWVLRRHLGQFVHLTNEEIHPKISQRDLREIFLGSDAKKRRRVSERKVGLMRFRSAVFQKRVRAHGERWI